MSESPVVVVTGAGSGVGRDTAIVLAEAGYNVVLVSRTESALQATAELARSEAAAGVEIDILPADVSQPDSAHRIVQHTLERFGRIDALANVAGAAPLMPIDRITPDAWRACIDTNLSAIVLLTAAVWPAFRKQRRGIIVNVSSMASIDPFPGFAMYAAAKIGVNLFTRCTADEGRKFGVKAVCIAPGAIETPMLRQNFNETVLPPDKCLDPMDLAAAIRDCITGARDFVSGETIVMNSP
jgi:NAD(P)-dependent dehydrogenase (short-subunit alcohol dehydrogenase family)